LVICRELVALGAKIQAFDPEANHTFRTKFGDCQDIAYVDNNYDALTGAHALLICTEWNAFRQPNFKRIKEELAAPVIFDGRNIFNPSDMVSYGITYYSIGRTPVVVR
jgi:UDPglucose 6-dehydrogenase